MLYIFNMGTASRRRGSDYRKYMPKLVILKQNLLLAYLVIRWRIFSKPTLFNLGDVANKRLVPCLHHFMEDDPIRLAVLSIESAILLLI